MAVRVLPNRVRIPLRKGVNKREKQKPDRYSSRGIRAKSTTLFRPVKLLMRGTFHPKGDVAEIAEGKRPTKGWKYRRTRKSEYGRKGGRRMTVSPCPQKQKKKDNRTHTLHSWNGRVR